jgi:glycosyltransferase involved in cell wall biosynthesis
LLKSIDYFENNEIEIIICEDKSPSRNEIIRIVDEFKLTSQLHCNLYLNELNLGYDENLKELIKRSSGRYIMYMGDDDVFQSESLKDYIDFLKKNDTLGYILRRYSIVHENGELEEFRYYTKNRFFEPGIEAFKNLFRKSVFISGFCFRRDFVISYFETNKFKGTLLYQLFLCGRLVLEYPSAYCNIPITIMDENQRGLPEFGSSINEIDKYTPGEISIDNSINFMKSFFVVTEYIDSIANFSATELFLKDLSKYSYPVLSIQRDRGIIIFMNYNKLLRKEIKINKTFYYYIYYYTLLLLGKKNSDGLIILIKKLLGRTPNL